MNVIIIREPKTVGANRRSNKVYIKEDQDYFYIAGVLITQDRTSHSEYWSIHDTVVTRPKTLYSDKGGYYYRNKNTKEYLDIFETQELQRFLNERDLQVNIP